MLIGGFQPFSLSDFPGKTAAIIFTQGCNFRCPYCHNKSLCTTNQEENSTSREQILSYLAKRQGKLEGVVITGGEPCLQLELQDFILSIKDLGFSVKLDTNGSKPEAVYDLLERQLLDYIAMDIKAPIAKYDLLSGCSVDIDAVIQSMQCISSSSVPHHFRTTVDLRYLNEQDVLEIEEMIPNQSKFVRQKCLPVT